MSDTAPPSGRLYLMPSPLDFGADAQAQRDLTDTIPLGALRIAARVEHWVVENAKTTRAFLKRVGAISPLARPLQDLRIVELPRAAKGRKDTPAIDWGALLAPACAGHDVALQSEAGLPGLADPGAALVAAAHAAGIGVEPLAGPSALALAVAASGLNGQCFAFVGYLPVDPGDRAKRIRELESASRQFQQTQMLIETPYRNQAMLAALLATLSPQTRLSVSCALTLPQGWTRSARVAVWRNMSVEMPADLPAVFCFLA